MMMANPNDIMPNLYALILLCHAQYSRTELNKSVICSLVNFMYIREGQQCGQHKQLLSKSVLISEV